MPLSRRLNLSTGLLGSWEYHLRIGVHLGGPEGNGKQDANDVVRPKSQPIQISACEPVARRQPAHIKSSFYP